MKKSVIFFVLLIGLVLPGLSQSEEKTEHKDKITIMEEVVVTGTRFEQKVEKVPAHVAIITADQIKASGAQSVPDVLGSLGGVLVRDLNGNRNNQTVDMGGFGETADRHVAVVINGRRINSIDQSNIRWTTIPVENIERIEILHGAGSVLYGDNAMGGVINIITKDWDGKTKIKSEAAVGSHDTRKGHVDVGFGTEQVGLNIGFTTYKTDGYRDRSETDRKLIYGKIRYDDAENTSIFFEMNLSDVDYQFPGVLTKAQRDQNRQQAINLNDEGMDQDVSAVLGLEKDWGEKGFWNIILSHRNENRDSDIASWWSYMKFNIDTNALTSQYILEKGPTGHDNRLTLGMEMYETEYDAYQGVFKGATTNIYEHEKKTFSVYVQDEFNIIDSLLLNMGVRFEDPEIKLGANIAGNKIRDEYDDSEWAWNLGLAYVFMPKSKVYARAYSAFRYPVVDEYTNLWTGAVNNQLKQETSVGFEAGVRMAFSSKLLLNLRIYTMDIDDEIMWNNAANQNENINETRHAGGEVDLRYSPLNYLTFYGGAGYVDAEFTTGTNEGRNIPLVPEWNANTGVEVNPGYGLKFRLQYNYVGERYFGGDYDNSLEKIEAYDTVDLYAIYCYKFAEIFLNATNMFNEKYSAAGWTGSYYPMPEAVYYGGIRINF